MTEAMVHSGYISLCLLSQVLNHASIMGHGHKSIGQKSRMDEEQMLRVRRSEESTPGVLWTGLRVGLRAGKNRVRSQAGVGIDRSQDQGALEESRRGERREPELCLEEVGKPGSREKNSCSRKESVHDHQLSSKARCMIETAHILESKDSGLNSQSIIHHPMSPGVSLDS